MRRPRRRFARGAIRFGMQRATLIRDAEDSKKLNDKPGTFITVSASGMCEAGRILHHLKHTIGDPQHTIVIIGYQAEGTLGRRLVEHVPEVKIFGEPFDVRARVVVLNGFSAHADHDALVAQALACGAPRGIAIVHADLERAEALKAALPSPRSRPHSRPRDTRGSSGEPRRAPRPLDGFPRRRSGPPQGSSARG